MSELEHLERAADEAAQRWLEGGDASWREEANKLRRRAARIKEAKRQASLRPLAILHDYRVAYAVTPGGLVVDL